MLTAKIAPRLNRPLTLTLELPADNPDIRVTAPDGDPRLTVGTRAIKAYRNGVLRANVIVWKLSYDGDADTAKVSVTGYDPMVQLRRRPARDETGDFSQPRVRRHRPPPARLVQDIVSNTIAWEGDLLIDPSGGTCDASTALGGNLGDWPVMIFDMFTIITDTGVVDIVLEPLEATPGKLAVLNAVDTWGNDSTDTVSFDYATGSYNVASRTADHRHGRDRQQALDLPRAEDRHPALARQHHRPQRRLDRQVRGLHGHPHLRLRPGERGPGSVPGAVAGRARPTRHPARAPVRHPPNRVWPRTRSTTTTSATSSKSIWATCSAPPSPTRPSGSTGSTSTSTPTASNGSRS